MPQVVNWYGRLKVEYLTREQYHELPRYVLLDMKTGTDLFYPDILIDPVLMVSREVMEIILRYDKNMPFLFVALFEVEKGESASYYCPVMTQDNHCGREVLYRESKPFGQEIRIRVDLAESLLSRGAQGLQLTHMER